MTLEEKEKKNQQNLAADKAELEFLRQENASYKSLLNMQNKSYFRAELVEAILILGEQMKDTNKVLLAIHKKQK